MFRNKVKALWREGQPAAVGWMGSPDPYHTETMAEVGFDALVLDMQHGMGIGPDRAADWIQLVARCGVTPFVRVPWNEPAFIQWVLDAGALGIIVPMINSYADAVKAGGACRYYPVGYRSVGPNRVRYNGGSDYFEHANEEVACLVMIEDIRTIPLLYEIATAPGIDGFYIGPADLSVTMGLPPAMDQSDPRHGEAMQQILDAATRNNLVCGRHCRNGESAARHFAQGFKFCPAATDIIALDTGARAELKAAGVGSVPSPATAAVD
jgi:4-hydroxy-2-oxoheptanedioate aldolase